MARRKNEAVSVSFHYLIRLVQEGGNYVERRFTSAEFVGLHNSLVAKPPIDMKDERIADKIRARLDAPIENVEKPTDRLITGTFRASYWGHEYQNTARGSIPADSISLRPFHFILYFGDNGRIYVGTQYLGQFGGYTALERTVSDLLPRSETIRSHSFRLGASHYRNAEPKEVRVNVLNRGSSIASQNTFGQKMTIAFTKSGKDDPMPAHVKSRLLPFLGGQVHDVRRAVARLVNESELIDVQDEDIEDCTVLASVNGRSQVIHMFENGSFATRRSQMGIRKE
ncbi:MAG: hypothetical protein E5Y02_16550 [Mesorhizobium sp.]|nr:MAG: hypothetical protein E5Y02_16550 [Mesorhizobium sp.]